MIASIQEMSSTNTQQLRVSSRRASRTRRSWQRRGLAILVVSTYLLQCATAHEADLRRLLNKTQRSDPAHRGLLKMTAIDREAHLTDIKLGFASNMEHEYRKCIDSDLIGTYTYTSKNPHTYTINSKRCRKCFRVAEDADNECQNRSCGNWGYEYDRFWKEDSSKSYIKRISDDFQTTDVSFEGDWGIFDSDGVLHFWSNDESPNGDNPPSTGWKANEFRNMGKYSSPQSEYKVNENEQVAKYIKITGANTYEVASSSSSESLERVECVYCEGSGRSTWYFTDCSHCDGDGYNFEWV